MAYDTIKIKSPPFDRTIMNRILDKCILRSGVNLSTGELLYELYTGGDLLGSWDSRISLKAKDEDYVIDENGHARLQKCEPYLMLEASVHKISLGHNVYGGPTDFQKAASDLVVLVEKLLEIELLPANLWTVHQVDVANVYNLCKSACKQFFDCMQLVNFPRRKKNAAKYDMSVYFPGKTTTVKFYHKGTEFKAHDYSRLRNYFKDLFSHMYGADIKNTERVEKKLQALQRLADKRLRVEVAIHSDKLQYDFGKNPTVAELTDAYLERLHDHEVERILREGKQGMDTVRTTDAVLTRLETHYGGSIALRLYGFWQMMCEKGDEKTKTKYKRTVFYRNRKQLEDVGVSWLGSNIVIVAGDSLIHDFTPMRVDRRFCHSPARNRPEYNLSRDSMLLAA
jgi:II/X family phage/plasmid replication protein